jgi:putative hydrolase of the HAD superfamily
MDEIVYVGDDPKRDVLGALNAGMRAIWYNPTSKPWPGGRTPTAVIRHLSDLEEKIKRL